MKSIIKIFVYCAISFPVLADLNWNSLPMEDIVKRAATDNKAVLIFFEASWCTYCHKMKKSVFTNDRIAKLMTQYHLVKVDGDDNGPGRELFNSYKASAFPTTIFLTSKGEEYDRAVGYFTVDAFGTVLKDNLSQKNTLVRLQEEIQRKQGMEQAELRYEYIEKLFDLSKWDVALSEIKKYILDTYMEQWAFDLRLLRGTIYLKQQNYKKAELYLKVAWAYAVSEEEYMQAVRWLARMYRKQGKKQKRLEVYEAAVERYGSYQAFNGYAWYASQDRLELDRALEYAREAVKLSKRDPGILDTLAEVHFARGEHGLALEISREILSGEEKDNETYKKRHEKYWKAQRDSSEAAGQSATNNASGT